MNWLDYTILTILGLSVLMGLWRGLISEVLSLVIWAMAFWICWTFGPSVAGYFEHSIPQPSARMLLGYGMCFVAVLILGALVRFVIGRLVAGTGLGGTDRLLGMVFGFARGVLIVSLGVFLMGFTPIAGDSWVRDSQMLPQFRGVADWLGSELPASVRGNFHLPDVLDHIPKLSVPSLPQQDTIDHLHPAAASTAAHQ
ncbi:membrane protein required for colicin V production [Luteibacter rhizovicinus]|uniref:Membrane protein required for colicin V production n=1 Tax=Luteibacter rhizovicinus TaxID=242606 RepID=A0A4V2W460_9GAMM|nr:CvpA family protein [Luteibacter rhizovicinus]TCV94629.1 membrane protein required for colicin V production [Luteibacter rhizovicinus]